MPTRRSDPPARERRCQTRRRQSPGRNESSRLFARAAPAARRGSRRAGGRPGWRNGHGSPSPVPARNPFAAREPEDEESSTIESDAPASSVRRLADEPILRFPMPRCRQHRRASRVGGSSRENAASGAPDPRGAPARSRRAPAAAVTSGSDGPVTPARGPPLLERTRIHGQREAVQVQGHGVEGRRHAEHVLVAQGADRSRIP